MIHPFLHKVLIGNSIQSVQVNLNGDSKEYRLIEVLKKKNDLSVVNQYDTGNFEELLDKLSKTKPLVLVVDGKGVLSKKVDYSTNYRSKMLFNSDPDDFYWYEYQQEKEIYASVARKDLVHQEIEAFTKAQISVLEVGLGTFVTATVQSLLEVTSLLTTSKQLFFEDGQLVDFKKNEDELKEDYQIGDEFISSLDIIGFANVVQYLYPNDSISTDIEDVSKNKEEFIYKKGFSILGIATLVFFLGSLLISYLLLNHYQNQHHKLQVALGEQNIAYEKLISLEKDKENKETILKESGIRDSNYLSFYISEITKNITSEISLESLTIFPTVSKIKKDQRINFQNNTIKIEGTVSTYSSFTSWIKSLKKLPFVENLEIIDFQQDKNHNSFVIKLIMKFDV